MQWADMWQIVMCFYFQVDARTGLGFRQQQRQGIIKFGKVCSSASSWNGVSRVIPSNHISTKTMQEPAARTARLVSSCEVSTNWMSIRLLILKRCRSGSCTRLHEWPWGLGAWVARCGHWPMPRTTASKEISWSPNLGNGWDMLGHGLAPAVV